MEKNFFLALCSKGDFNLATLKLAALNSVDRLLKVQGVFLSEITEKLW